MTRHLLTVFSVSCALLGIAFGCPYGSFPDPDDSDYCFTVHPELQSWSAAADVCNSEGGNLVSVHDSRTNRLLKKLGEKGMDDSFMWIGANNYNGGGSTWTWQDGTPFDFTRWGRGEPGVKNPGNGCSLYIIANERWYNDNCDLASPFICRVSATASPLPPTGPVTSSSSPSSSTGYITTASSSPGSSTTYPDFTTPSPYSSSSPGSSSTTDWLTTSQPSSSTSPSSSSSSSSSSTTSEWQTTSYPTTSTSEGSF